MNLLAPSSVCVYRREIKVGFQQFVLTFEAKSLRPILVSEVMLIQLT